jgi:hypothetical protein
VKVPPLKVPPLKVRRKFWGRPIGGGWGWIAQLERWGWRQVCHVVGHDEFPLTVSYWIRGGSPMSEWRRETLPPGVTGCRRCGRAPLVPVTIPIEGTGTQYVDGIEGRFDPSSGGPAGGPAGGLAGGHAK